MRDSSNFGGSGGFEGFEKYERRRAITASGTPRLSRGGNCEVFSFGGPIEDEPATQTEQAALEAPEARQEREEFTGPEVSQSSLKRRSYMPTSYQATDSNALLSAAQVGGGVIGRTFAGFFIRRGIIFAVLGAFWLIKIVIAVCCSAAYESNDRTGTAYYASRMYPEAIHEYQRGLSCKDVPPVERARLTAEIGRCYNGMEAPQIALSDADKALHMVPPYDNVDSDAQLSEKLEVQALCHSVKRAAYEQLGNKFDAEFETAQYVTDVKRIRHLAAHPRKN